MLLSLKAQCPAIMWCQIWWSLVSWRKKKGKMEWDFEYNNNTITFAIDPYVIYFVEQGVDTGFKREFLASAVEWVDGSGQYLSNTLSTCLWVLVSPSQCAYYRNWTVFRQSPMQHQCKDNNTAQYIQRLSEIGFFHFYNFHAAISRCWLAITSVNIWIDFIRSRSEVKNQ